MRKVFVACAFAVALAGCVAPVQKTANGEIPAARIYIKSMTEQTAGMSKVEFRRDTNFLYSREMLELAINDVVLAQIDGGEHLAIWLKPGRYVFTIKPVHTLNTPTGVKSGLLDLEVKPGADSQVQIVSNSAGISLQQGK